MHRITGNKTNPSPDGKPAVLLMHGIVASSIGWVIAGPERSLGNCKIMATVIFFSQHKECKKV